MIKSFQPGGNLYPYRWFIAFATALTMGMTYVDYTGWRLFTAGSNPQQGYYGGPTSHK